MSSVRDAEPALTTDAMSSAVVGGASGNVHDGGGGSASSMNTVP
jgi:hypothetical protein